MNNGNELIELLKQRILVLDGAMGTLIQQHGLEEGDFRGERFSDPPRDLKGCNDLLSPFPSSTVTCTGCSPTWPL